MSDLNAYTVKIEGFILGVFKKKNDTVHLTVGQAREFLFEGRLEEKVAKPLPTPAKPDGKAA